MGSMKPDWLAQLAPAHAPHSPGWWPLAPGWWGLLVLILIAGVIVLYRYNRPVMRTQRAALRELKQFEALQLNDNGLARNLESLMRRYAVSRFGRETVAKLTGADWMAFVVRHRGEAFAGAAGAEFLSAAWGKAVSGQRTVWLKGAQQFIKEKP